ncbi:MAG: membrane protease subunit HflC [Verrucomicrobiales bacterium]|jgi:membrane protease subunit HflC
MKKNLPILSAGIVILLLFILLQVIVIVREGEVAVLTQFGKPVKELTTSGRYTRLPWPIQRVYRFDGRLRTMETSFEEAITQDKKNVLIGMFAAWRITKPTVFLEKIGSEIQAESSLDGLVRSHRSALLGQIPFTSLVNTNRDLLAFETLETEMLSRIQEEALSLYGIEVVSIGVHKLGLPEANTQAVFQRMKADLLWEAEKYNAQGLAEAEIIKAGADADRAEILARAEREAKETLAQAEEAATEFYKPFQQDPAFANFLKELETLEEIFDEKTAVILDMGEAPFRQLKPQGNNPAAVATPKPAEGASTP